MLERKNIFIDITVIKSLHPKPVFKLQYEANHSLQYTECSSKGKQSLAASVLWKKKNTLVKILYKKYLKVYLIYNN